MRARVIKLYRDKNSKSYRKIGDMIKMSEERFEEINSTSFGIFLERVEEPDEEIVMKSEAEPTEAEPTEVELTADKPPADEKQVDESPAVETHSVELPADEPPAVEKQVDEPNVTKKTTETRKSKK